jgi:hypothetical protein
MIIYTSINTYSTAYITAPLTLAGLFQYWHVDFVLPQISPAYLRSSLSRDFARHYVRTRSTARPPACRRHHQSNWLAHFIYRYSLHLPHVQYTRIQGSLKCRTASAHKYTLLVRFILFVHFELFRHIGISHASRSITGLGPGFAILNITTITVFVYIDYFIYLE